MSVEFDSVNIVERDPVEVPEQYLDPVAICAKIALLLLMKEEGVRLSLGSRKCVVQLPSDYSLFGISMLGLWRRICWDSRNDIGPVGAYIEKAMNWFPPDNEINRLFFENVALGLGKLYKDSKLIQDAFSKWKDNIKQGTGSIKEELHHPIWDQRVKAIWSDADLATINHRIKEALENPELREKAISCINPILAANELEVKKILTPKGEKQTELQGILSKMLKSVIIGE